MGLEGSTDYKHTASTRNPPTGYTRMKINSSGQIVLRSATGVETIIDNVKNNFAATTAPGVGNDGTEGYAIGSQWVDTATDKIYGCTDTTTGAAVWVDLSAAGGGLINHAATHTNGTDDIQSATNAQKGLATSSHITDIEANNAHRVSPHAPADAQANVKSDWNSISGDSEILNKPTTITAQQTTDIGLNNTHRSSDGKDHSDVGLNNAHRVSAHAPANAQKNSDILKTEIEAKLTGEITTHTHPDGTTVMKRDSLLVAGSVNNNTVQVVSAAYYTLYTSSGVAVVLSGIPSLSASLTSSGSGGLDTGSEAVSTIYYKWLIWNGATVALMLSLSQTAPVMPSGYTYRRMVGAAYNDASGNIMPYYQRGRDVEYIGERVIQAGSFTGNTWTAVNLAPFFPMAVCERVLIHISLQSYAALSHRSDGEAGKYTTNGDASATDFGGRFASSDTRRETMDILVSSVSTSIYYYFASTGGTMSAIGYKLADF